MDPAVKPQEVPGDAAAKNSSLFGCLGLIAILTLCGGIMELINPTEPEVEEVVQEVEEPEVQLSSDPIPVYPTPSNEQKWYQGGSLHQSSGLDWINGSPANRLATCADFISIQWNDNALEPSIQNSISSIDDMKPYAFGLMTALNAAFAMDESDPSKRRALESNTVAGTAALLMVTMNYVKR
jgi:hypothetical protein